MEGGRGRIIPCHHRPRGSCECGCSGRGTRRAPREGACGTNAPNGRSRGRRRCSRPGGGRGGRHCGRERLVSDISFWWFQAQPCAIEISSVVPIAIQSQKFVVLALEIVWELGISLG